jgi:hypothetical protein
MARPTPGPAGLQGLVALALPVCPQAEPTAPRTGPGRRPDIPDWPLAVLNLVALLARKKTRSTPYRTQVLGATFAYQVLLRDNHQRGASDGQVKAIVDRL